MKKQNSTATVGSSGWLGRLVCASNQIVQKRKHLLSAEVIMAFGPLTKLLVKSLALVEWLTLYNICLCQSAVALPGTLELRGGNIIGHIAAGRADTAYRGLVAPDKFIAAPFCLQVNRLKLGLDQPDAATKSTVYGCQPLEYEHGSQ